jgi:hypothetical protein
MRQLKRISLALTYIATLTLAAASSHAEENQNKDNTGTNPINFSRDFRVYNEFSALNTEGDGTQSLTTAEIRLPFLDGAWQWRLRARLNSIEADLNDDGSDDLDDSGLGDWDMRFLTVLNLDKETKSAWASGLEVFLNTADEDALGAGSTSLGPQVFYVKFLPRGLFAPGLQYKFSVDEDSGRSEVDQWLIDLNYLRMAEDKLTWFFTDPQIVIDNENDQEFAIVDLEWGWMMANWWPESKGQSFYIRPSIGVGADRPAEGSIEIGYKFVGW